MKAELIVNNVKVELGHKEINELSYIFEKDPKYKDLFHELAQSPCTETRAHVASQDYLHRKTIRSLVMDDQIEVMRSVVNKGVCVTGMEKEDVERYVNTVDYEVVSGLINLMEDLTDEYEVCEKDWLCEKIAHLSDPSIRLELAESENTSEFILKKLVNDPDLNVAEAAKETLEDRTIEEDPDAIDEEDTDDDFEI